MDGVVELQRHGRSSVARSAPAPVCAERWALCAETLGSQRTGVYSTGTVELTDSRTRSDDAGAGIGLTWIGLNFVPYFESLFQLALHGLWQQM